MTDSSRTQINTLIVQNRVLISCQPLHFYEFLWQSDWSDWNFYLCWWHPPWLLLKDTVVTYSSSVFSNFSEHMFVEFEELYWHWIDVKESALYCWNVWATRNKPEEHKCRSSCSSDLIQIPIFFKTHFIFYFGQNKVWFQLVISVCVC